MGGKRSGSRGGVRRGGDKERGEGCRVGEERKERYIW